MGKFVQNLEYGFNDTRNVIELEDFKVTINGRSFQESPTQRYKKTRLYGVLDTFVKETLDAEPYQGEFLYTEKIQPGMWAELSESDREAMTVKTKTWNVWKRQCTLAGKKQLRKALQQLEKVEGIRLEWDDAQKQEIEFSVYAGCSCPCSPGFILKGFINADGIVGPVDVWFEKKEEVQA